MCKSVGLTLPDKLMCFYSRKTRAKVFLQILGVSPVPLISQNYYQLKGLASFAARHFCFLVLVS